MQLHDLLKGLLCLTFILGCNTDPEATSASDEQSGLTHDQVIQRIMNGELGDALAERAKKTDNPWMQEIDQEVVPMQIFYYADYASGVSVLVENDKLILLCAGWGSGPISDLAVVSTGGQKVLKYAYTIGMGIEQDCEGEYVLGSGVGFSEPIISETEDSSYTCDE